ncbi:MAG: hypothetical protein RL166_355 [Actinomycetota bacterium]
MSKLVRSLISCLISISLIGLPAVASQASTSNWDTPTQLTTSTGYNGAKVVVSPTGDSLAYWSETINGQLIARMMTKARTSSTWSSAESISSESSNALNLSMAIDAEGNLSAIWLDNATPYSIQARYKESGQAWGPIVAIGGGGTGFSAGQLHVVSDQTGNVTAFWAASISSTQFIEAVERPKDGSWGTVDSYDLGTRGASNITAKVSGTGKITLAYERNSSSGVKTATTQHRVFGTTWSAPHELSDGSNAAYTPNMFLDSQGDLHYSWHVSSITESRVQIRTLKADSAWTNIETLSPANQTAVEHYLITDADETLTLFYVAMEPGAQYHIYSMSKPVGGTWNTPTDFSDPSIDAGTMHLSKLASGEIQIVWKSQASGANKLMYSSKPAGLNWSTPIAIQTSASSLREESVAFSPDGSISTLWTQSLRVRGQINPVLSMWLTSMKRTYTITFDSLGGEFTPTTINHTTGTSDIVLPVEGTVLKLGYRLTGWNTKADGSGQAVNSGAAFAPAGDTTLYAQWRSEDSEDDLAETGSDLRLVFCLGLLAALGGSAIFIWNRQRPAL